MSWTRLLFAGGIFAGGNVLNLLVFMFMTVVVVMFYV